MFIPYPDDLISAKAAHEPIFERNFVRACFVFSLIEEVAKKSEDEREEAILEATKKILEMFEEDTKK